MTTTSDLELPLAAVRRQRRAVTPGSRPHQSLLRAERLIEAAMEALAKEHGTSQQNEAG